MENKKRIPWNKGKHISNNQTGMHHYNNGVKNITAKECPPGYVVGWLKNEKNEEIVAKRKQTCLDKYGSATYNNPEKNKETCFEKYGASTYIHSKEGKKQVEATNIQKYGKAHPMHLQKGLATLREKYNLETLENVSQIPEIRAKIQQTNLLKYGTIEYMGSEDFKEKTKQTNLNNYGTEYYAQTSECHNKMHKKIIFDNQLFDSSWETDVYKFCIRNNISVERNIPIEYWYNNKKHITFIDFKIDDYLVEVKGTHLLEGVYSDRIVPITEKFKVYRENHVIIITKTDHPDEIFSNFNNLNQLIGIDIDLFRGSDYLNIDENLKWDLIKYQIEQFVNYIDSKSLQILLKNNLK